MKSTKNLNSFSMFFFLLNTFTLILIVHNFGYLSLKYSFNNKSFLTSKSSKKLIEQEQLIEEIKKFNNESELLIFLNFLNSKNVKNFFLNK